LVVDAGEEGVDGAGGDPDLGELAGGAAGRCEPEDRSAGLVVEVVDGAGGERLAGPGQRFDDVHAVARGRDAAHDVLLLVGKGLVPAGEEPVDLVGVDAGGVGAGAAEGGGDESPFGLDEVGGRVARLLDAGEVAGPGRQHVRVLQEGAVAVADLVDPETVSVVLGDRGERVALVEGVGVAGQAVGADQPCLQRRDIVDRIQAEIGRVVDARRGPGGDELLWARLVDGEGALLEALAARGEELVDRVVVEAVLLGAGDEVDAPVAGADRLVLGGPGLQRDCFGAGFRVEGDVSVAGGLLDLDPAAGELPQHVAGDPVQFGGALDDRPPRKTEAVGDLCPKVGLVEHAGGPGVTVDDGGVQRAPLTVRWGLDKVARDDVRVQLGVLCAGHAVAVGGRDEPDALLDDRAVAAPAGPHGLVFQVAERGVDRGVVRGDQAAGGLEVGEREEHRHRLRGGEREVVGGDRGVALTADDPRLAFLLQQAAVQCCVAWVEASDHRVEPRGLDPAGKPELPGGTADPKARRFAASGVVIVAALRDGLLVVGGLAGDELPDRKHTSRLHGVCILMQLCGSRRSATRP
jgi:hypothetical protein